MNDCFIRDVLVAPGTGEAPFHGWVEIQGESIAAVGRGTDSSTGGQHRVIDGGGAALLPGFVNTHAHSHSSLTRGSAEGVPLEAWLAVIENEQAQLTDEQAYVGALATYAEALLSGTTTILDMCLRPEPAMAAARDIGIRAVIVPYVADEKPFAPSLARNAELLAAMQADARVRVWVGVHDLESCSDATIRAAAELARKHRVGLHLHCSESRHSVERTRSRTGRTPVAQLNALNALGERTLLAHCVWLTDEDRALLASTGTHVAHCPHANLKLASGIAPVPDLCARGINVTLATDGAKANNRLDMFDVMKFASLLHKGVSGDAGVLPPERVLAMATSAGAGALDVAVGTIEPGRKADLVLLRLDALHLQPGVSETLLTNLVHAARGSDVEMAMVNGRVVVKDGRLADARWADLAGRMRQAGLALLR